MKFDDLTRGLSSVWGSVADGWQHMRESASSAITGFKPSEQTNLPARTEVDDPFHISSMSWSMLGGDVFEDAVRVVVRLELPGLDKNDLDIAVQGGSLVVRGEKRFVREDSEGRYRALQCAYGSFRRVVALPAEVQAEQAKATYSNGVLRVELPKFTDDTPSRRIIKVE